MDKKTKVILSALIFVIFLAGAYFAYNYLSEEYKPEVKTPAATASPASTPNKPKNNALDFTVTDSNGNKVKLSDFFGKPIVLNFWASWCSPCRSEMPHFEKVYRSVGKDVQFLMVDLVDKQRETIADAKKFIESNGFTFPVYYDENQDAARVYRITSIPTTILIDRSGSIVKRYTGAMQEETLLAAIDLIK